jgi:serine/threonine-protein kinase
MNLTQELPVHASPPPRPDDVLLPGARFGRYEVVRRLGSGGSGSVYEARHVDLQKVVALKTLHAEYARDPAMRERFLAEAMATSRLRHPHVVDVSDYGVQDGAAFLVMEYLEGEDLASLLAREGALSPDRIVELLVPLCAAVSATHDAGIVHRDLKPENLFLARNALGQLQPKVLDFGISKVISAGDDLRDPGTADLIGTPCYMSPEQAQGAAVTDARSDQYALGVILYECATGRLPFEGDTLYALLEQISAGVFPAPRTLRPELPARFERVILRAMHKSPARRYPSALALARDLLAFAGPLARSTWEPVLASPDGNDPFGEDPTARFVSPLRRPATIPPRVPPSLALSTTLEPRPRPIAARRGPRTVWRERAVVAVSALCTLLAVMAATHARLSWPAAVTAPHATTRPRRATTPPVVTPVVLQAPVAPPVIAPPELTPLSEPTCSTVHPPRAGRHHPRTRKGGRAS